jgi:hypothetical protein
MVSRTFLDCNPEGPFVTEDSRLMLGEHSGTHRAWWKQNADEIYGYPSMLCALRAWLKKRLKIGRSGAWRGGKPSFKQYAPARYFCFRTKARGRLGRMSLSPWPAHLLRPVDSSALRSEYPKQGSPSLSSPTVRAGSTET